MREPPVRPEEAAVELALAVKRLRARLRAEAGQSGWTISQLAALSRLVREGPTTASGLARAEHVRPQSMAAIIATLRDADLVAASPDPDDGRKTVLRATAAGARLVKQRTVSREAWLTRAIEALTDEGRARTLVEAIDLLNALADWRADDRAGTGARR